MNKTNEEHIFKQTALLFAFLFTLVCAFLGASLVLFYRTETNGFLDRLKQREQNTINLQIAAITSDFSVVFSDLAFLSRQSQFEHLKYQGSKKVQEVLGELAEEYLNMVATKKYYDQIRYLDLQGMELVRTDYNDGSPVVLPSGKLQDTNSLHLFSKSMTLKKNEVYISPMDLSLENGAVEVPFKPVIRLAEAVFNENGEKRGLVLINYQAAKLLEHLNQAGDASRGADMLLNDQGYWLLSPNKEQEWGFMFPDRQHLTFANAYPEEWRTMLQDKKGQIRTGNGLFTYSAVHPVPEWVRTEANPLDPADMVHAGLPDYSWILVSHVSREVLDKNNAQLLLKLALFGAVVFVFSVGATWILSLSIVKRRAFQARILKMAQFDQLTGLPNRQLFFDRLEMGLRHAERYERRLGLLYIDLDGFKGVNDTMGHHAGDELLVHVAEVLANSTRRPDTVARLGGDEFAVILSEVRDVEDSLHVGEKLVEALCRPVHLTRGLVTIGASVGAAVYPDHDTDPEELLKRADEAMYEAKGSGKNRCVAAAG